MLYNFLHCLQFLYYFIYHFYTIFRCCSLPFLYNFIYNFSAILHCSPSQFLFYNFPFSFLYNNFFTIFFLISLQLSIAVACPQYPGFAGVLSQYVHDISGGKIPCIESAVLTTAASINQVALDEAIARYRDAMADVNMLTGKANYPRRFSGVNMLTGKN